MGTISPTANVTNQSALFSRYYLIDQSQVFDLYVNSDTGVDTGQVAGSEADPYLTIARALSEVSAMSNGARFAIHLSGVLPHVVPPGFEIVTMFDSGDLAPTESGDFFAQRAVLSFEAEPLINVTIPGANITGQAIDPTTGLNTLTVTNVLVAGALAGKSIKLPDGTIAAVHDNGVNTIEVAVNGVISTVGTAQVFTPGATIECSTPGEDTPTITVRGGGFVGFSGVTIANDTPAKAFPSIGVVAGARVLLQGCALEGFWVAQDLMGDELAGQLNAQGCVFSGSTYAMGPGAVAIVSNSFMDAINCSSQAQSSSAKVVVMDSFVDDCDGFFSDASAKRSVGDFTVSSIEFNAPKNAIEIYNGVALINDCKIDNAVGAAVTVANNSFAQLLGCTGAGNALGLVVDNGAQVQTDPTTSILSVGAEVTVGTLAGVTWAAFHGAPARADFTAVTGDGSRLFE